MVISCKKCDEFNWWKDRIVYPTCISFVFFFWFLIELRLQAAQVGTKSLTRHHSLCQTCSFFFFSISFLIFHRKQHIVFELMISSWLLAEQCHSKSFFFFIFRWFFKMIFLFQTKKNTKKASWGRTNRLNSFFVCLLFFFFFFFLLLIWISVYFLMQNVWLLIARAAPKKKRARRRSLLPRLLRLSMTV